MTTVKKQQAGPVISAWAAVSPFGVGRAAFVDGVGAGHGAPSPAPAGPEGQVGPDELAYIVPDFSAKEALGKKGTRSMDRLTALAVATVGQLVERATPADRQPTELIDGVPTAGRALVLGTTTGSAQSMMDFTRSSMTSDRPYLVDPARFPNTVMNCAAGQAAIWYQLTGPNATIGGGRAAGLLALNYARRLQRTKRAESVLCGAAEEYSPARAWLQRQASDTDEPAAVLGEGCAMLQLEPAGSAGIAEVAAIEFGVYDQSVDIATVVESCVRRALAEAGATPADVWVVAPGDAAGSVGTAERAAITEVLGEATPQWVSCTELIGDTSAAAATFQLVSVLALADHTPADADRLALITAVDRDGVVGAAVLRLLATDSSIG